MTELLPEGANGVVYGRGAIVPLSAAEEGTVVAGAPRDGILELGELGGCEAGIWELRDGTVTDTEVDELFVVIAGGASIEFLDEHRTIDVKTGDVVRLTAGTRTRWTVKDFIRKVYFAANSGE